MDDPWKSLMFKCIEPNWKKDTSLWHLKVAFWPSQPWNKIKGIFPLLQIMVIVWSNDQIPHYQ